MIGTDPIDSRGRSQRTLRSPALAVGVAALLSGVFVLRPLLNRPGTNPTGPLVALFITLGIVGAAWPVLAAPSGAPSYPVVATRWSVRTWWRSSAPIWAAVLLLGMAAFVVGRVLGRGTPAAPFAWRVVAINSLAAVAEEAFFRRLVYSLLWPTGAFFAVVGSAALFAVAHVTVYGFWVLPVDVAAGLLLGWQRWATGSWAVPAVTHVVANALMLL